MMTSVKNICISDREAVIRIGDLQVPLILEERQAAIQKAQEIVASCPTGGDDSVTEEWWSQKSATEPEEEANQILRMMV